MKNEQDRDFYAFACFIGFFLAIIMFGLITQIISQHQSNKCVEIATKDVQDKQQIEDIVKACRK